MEQEQEAAAMEPEVDLSPEEMKEAEREVIEISSITINH